MTNLSVIGDGGLGEIGEAIGRCVALTQAPQLMSSGAEMVCRIVGEELAPREHQLIIVLTACGGRIYSCGPIKHSGSLEDAYLATLKMWQDKARKALGFHDALALRLSEALQEADRALTGDK